ncbi:hypothetical protein HOF92_09180 [bacterium]|jgi:hypothetical protein|nr:hypothetical protein [bacterium]
MQCSLCGNFRETQVPSLGLCTSQLDGDKNCSLVDAELRACTMFVAIQERMNQIRDNRAA